MFRQAQAQFSQFVAHSSEQCKAFLRKDFYRKVEFKSWLKRVSDDAVAHPKKYVGFAIIGFVLFYVLFGDYGVISRIRFEVQRAQLQSELDAEVRRTEALKAQIENAKSLETIEKLAREKYGFSKKGETVYIIK
ncbi:MAG: septum formation initiator family protein [Chloroherpetonaceae bacterium]